MTALLFLYSFIKFCINIDFLYSLIKPCIKIFFFVYKKWNFYNNIKINTKFFRKIQKKEIFIKILKLIQNF